MKLVRAGKPSDIPDIVKLFARDVAIGVRDSVASPEILQRRWSSLRWSSDSRVIAGVPEALGAAVVTGQPGTSGLIERVDVGALDPADWRHLLEWGVQRRPTTSIEATQVWLGAGHRYPIAGLGLDMVRRYWRMDLLDLSTIGAPAMPEGYSVQSSATWRSVAETYNAAVAEHWRFSPADPAVEPDGDHAPDLSLAIGDSFGTTVAMAWCYVEDYVADRRPQPVGFLYWVATLPGHRRRGLGTALVLETLHRMKAMGARSVCLFVDAANSSKAYDIYRSIGFRTTFEYEVYELRQPS